MKSTIQLFELRSCLKYQAACQRRNNLLRAAYRSQLNVSAPDKVANLVSDAINIGTQVGLYASNDRVIGRPA